MPEFTRGVRFILASFLTVSATSAFAAGPQVVNNALQLGDPSRGRQVRQLQAWRQIKPAAGAED
jgi:hypothetical protein